MQNLLRRAVLGFAAAFAALSLTQCAALSRGNSPVPRVALGSAERLVLRVAPFDSTVRAELARSGLDPARFEEDFSTELRYRFFLRKQEEARDSAGADVVLTVTARHFQPGAGSIGTFASLAMRADRNGQIQRTEWTWRAPARANAPAEFLPRHLARTAADQVMDKIKTPRPKSDQPPPPLILLQ